MEICSPIPVNERTKISVPIAADLVEAGFPSPAEDYFEQDIDLNEELISNPIATFFVRAKGYSMKGEGIHDGDILIVDKSIDPKARQICIAQMNGEFTVKRLRHVGGRVYLEPANPDYQTLEVADTGDYPTVWGVVTFIIYKAR